MKASPWLDLGCRVGFEDRRGAGGKCTHVEREHDVLGHDFTGGIQNRATCVLGFSDNRRVAGAKQRVLHLLNDAGQPGLDDLQSYGIDGHGISDF